MCGLLFIPSPRAGSFDDPLVPASIVLIMSEQRKYISGHNGLDGRYFPHPSRCRVPRTTWSRPILLALFLVSESHDLAYSSLSRGSQPRSRILNLLPVFLNTSVMAFPSFLQSSFNIVQQSLPTERTYLSSQGKLEGPLSLSRLYLSPL